MEKNKSPAFLLYAKDFMIDVMDMTDEEAGQYIKLMCRQHIQGNIHPRFIEDLSEEVKSKFVRDNQGNYYNRELKRNSDKRNKYSESRRSNRLSGSQSKKHMKDISSTHEESYEKHMDNEDVKEKEDENEYENNKVGEFTEHVIATLNQTCGTKYKATSKKTKSLVHARMEEGFTLEDFETVIAKKATEWTGTEYEKFLRPETLFGTKFEGYLNQKQTKKGGNKFLDLVGGYDDEE